MQKLQKVIDWSLMAVLVIFIALLITWFSLDNKQCFFLILRCLLGAWICGVVTCFFWVVIRGMRENRAGTLDSNE